MSIERIRWILTDVHELTISASFKHDPGLYVHWAGMWNGHYIAVHAKDVLSVLGQDIPEYGTFLTLPASEAANLRAAATGGVR